LCNQQTPETIDSGTKAKINTQNPREISKKTCKSLQTNLNKKLHKFAAKISE